MAEALITYRGTVYPWQCDHVGHITAARKACVFPPAVFERASAWAAGRSAPG